MSEWTPPPDAAATRKGEYRESRRHLSRSTCTRCIRPRLEKRKLGMAEDDVNADINRFLTASPRSSTEARRCFSPPEDRGFRASRQGHQFIRPYARLIIIELHKKLRCTYVLHSLQSGIGNIGNAVMYFTRQHRDTFFRRLINKHDIRE